MNVNGAGGSSFMPGIMAGVGVRTLNMAQQAQTDMAKKILPMQVAENAGRAAAEAKGLFVDTYA